MHNFKENNLKNNMHFVILDCNKLLSDLFSRCVFGDINRMRYHSILKLISVLNNLANDNSEKTKPLIMYSANSHPIYLNDLENEHYFTRAFPTIFLFGDNGHFVKRKIAISLQV